MYLLAVAVGAEARGAQVAEQLAARGAGPVATFLGVSIEESLAFNPHRQIDHGSTWILWRDDPVPPTEPDSEAVARWTRALMAENGVESDA